ncbi:hypothetical protein SAMN05878482_110115 [Peribacillus simplex]|uniref:Uncharacterized protein n=1 Tax=Peribacillus simplex TaxID=1478 RepID=A0A9X8WN12_9BACI|nr:hypothetical protein SAMN05878482_110115 [Peribacillus simplex]
MKKIALLLINLQKENGKSNVVGMNDIVQNAMTLDHT